MHEDMVLRPQAGKEYGFREGNAAVSLPPKPAFILEQFVDVTADTELEPTQRMRL